jgi:hypothetical protein
MMLQRKAIWNASSIEDLSIDLRPVKLQIRLKFHSLGSRGMRINTFSMLRMQLTLGRWPQRPTSTRRYSKRIETGIDFRCATTTESRPSPVSPRNLGLHDRNVIKRSAMPLARSCPSFTNERHGVRATAAIFKWIGRKISQTGDGIAWQAGQSGHCSFAPRRWTGMQFMSSSLRE